MPADPIRFAVDLDEASLEEAQRKIASIDDELARNWAYASQEAAKEIIGREGLQRYPPSRPGAPQPFKSDKARRYFFASLRRGEIEVPYRRGQSPRSETYGKQWYVESQGLIATVGNRASYARYLAGETEQSGYMAARGWRRLIEVAQEARPEIVKIYEGWMERVLRNL